ncbi:MAG: G5 domain-containing protein [Candidatus Moranbacteria bacterium]|nr:G5 domain-containing protein [Candidatus Moranbacteria bacterium]
MIWIAVLLALGLGARFFSTPEKAADFAGASKRIMVRDDGLSSEYAGVASRTVGDFIEQHEMHLRSEDIVYPDRETPLVSGMKIIILRAREIRVTIDREEQISFTQSVSVESALLEAGLSLDTDDIVKPARETQVSDHMRISVTRVEIREETKVSDIPFESKVTEDDGMSWRKKVTSVKGEKGTKTTTYRVAYHDNKEVSRKIIGTEITKEPVTEKITQGTRVEVGKSHRGAASWYAWTGTMAAANPWLPKGSYVRVTNLENGKSVIVVINDRGPFVPGRIIDLDKVAFQKIASIGAGVINVKMEEITN